MPTVFGLTFSIGIRDDNQQNAVLVPKRAPERYDPDDLDIMDRTHYKHQLQDSATHLARRPASHTGFWHVDGQVLPVSTSLKYLGLIFHEAGSLTKALDRLLQNSHGARARLAAKYKALSCDSNDAPPIRSCCQAHRGLWL